MGRAHAKGGRGGLFSHWQLGPQGMTNIHGRQPRTPWGAPQCIVPFKCSRNPGVLLVTHPQLKACHTSPQPPLMCAASPPILQLIWLFHAAAHISSCWLGSLSYLILQGITQPKRFSISTAVGVIRATDMWDRTYLSVITTTEDVKNAMRTADHCRFWNRLGPCKWKSRQGAYQHMAVEQVRMWKWTAYGSGQWAVVVWHWDWSTWIWPGDVWLHPRSGFWKALLSLGSKKNLCLPCMQPCWACSLGCMWQVNPIYA